MIENRRVISGFRVAVNFEFIIAWCRLYALSVREFSSWK